MKTNIKLLTFSILLLLNVPLFGQNDEEIKSNQVEGLFLSVDDFKNGILTHPTDRKHKADRIKLKQFFISPKIISIEQDKETVFYKDSIFAIHLSNGENYRFINRTPCFLADTSFLYIYTFKTIKTEYRMSGPHRREKEIPITYYFFSMEKHKAIYMLNLYNLQRVFRANNTINSIFLKQFITNEMLYEINSATGRFLINETIISILKNN